MKLFLFNFLLSICLANGGDVFDDIEIKETIPDIPKEKSQFSADIGKFNCKRAFLANGKRGSVIEFQLRIKKQKIQCFGKPKLRALVIIDGKEKVIICDSFNIISGEVNQRYSIDFKLFYPKITSIKQLEIWFEDDDGKLVDLETKYEKYSEEENKDKEIIKQFSNSGYTLN